ncbi:amino acid transporter AVT1C-like protein [Tanacetum coccineum]
MKNQEESADCIFIVEGENDNEDKDVEGDENEDKYFDADEDVGKDSDPPKYADEDPHHPTKPDTLDPSWPQSYRKSMDLLASQSLNFLGSPTFSSLGGSFLSSSPKRRYTPDTITSLEKPLLPTEADKQLQEHFSSDPSLNPQWTSSMKNLSHQKSFKMKKSSFSQAVINGVNLLCGVGLLSTPYAAKQGGWVGLSILFIFCGLSLYTGILLSRCLDSRPGLKSYPDIGEAAFGRSGRLIISIILYVELYAACVEYIILESDNLSSLFPTAYLSIGGHQLSSHYLFAIMVTLAVLPTVWLSDMSILSYISGHAVLPNIYTSMENRSQFPLVLLASFAICTFLYAGVAIMGYMMFGEATESQFTLNLPANFAASKIAVWATNDIGDLYYGCGPHIPILWPGYVADRIPPNDASDTLIPDSTATRLYSSGYTKEICLRIASC